LVADSDFHKSIYLLLTPKKHFLMPILPFLAMFLMALKGYVYTISVDIYAYRLASSGILPCI